MALKKQFTNGDLLSADLKCILRVRLTHQEKV